MFEYVKLRIIHARGNGEQVKLFSAFSSFIHKFYPFLYLENNYNTPWIINLLVHAKLSQCAK